ncbi:MAG: glycerol-3-phosphate dehydrogenase/oxidase [Planctomycetota bacterium]
MARLRDRAEPWDIAIIGGGATGLGAAVDAASRGYDVCLLERADFAQGTSSRSTKLVHGGVRYLQQGNIGLVMEALRERGRLLRNAPHIVSDLAFVVPSYEWWELPWYGIGLKVYDTLAGRYGFGRSGHLSRREVVEAIPSISTDGLRGGTRYYDGQFDDARLAICLALTATQHGATLANYTPVIEFIKSGGVVTGLVAQDAETDEILRVPARAVINATGPFSDEVRRLDHADTKRIIRPSQGTHIVLDGSFLPGDHAIMVPHTTDGRVLFAIPWMGVCVLGTTDVPLDEVTAEPTPTHAEIDFILDTANRYLAQPATRADILSVFAGIRPLVQDAGGDSTSSISRDHSILIDQDSGLITIAGGKWTTYRRMAEEVIDQAASLADLEPRRCVTHDLAIARDVSLDGQGRLIEAFPVTAEGVRSACSHTMARTVGDILARRSRCLLLDAAGSSGLAEPVADIMASELAKGAEWVANQIRSFAHTVKQHRPD